MTDLLDRLPHRPPMLLLEGAEGAEAWMRVDPLAWYADPGGALPGWFGLELMAQAVAATRPPGEGPRRGYLVGTRAYRSPASFPGGSLLRVRVGPGEEDPSGLCTYPCEILVEGAAVASATLSVYRP